MAKKWLVRIPFEGVAIIPIERNEKPTGMYDEEISNKLHTNYMDEGRFSTQFFRNKGEIEETDDRTYEDYRIRAEKAFHRKASRRQERIASRQYVK
jgi:ABC-type uncharacterized transport system ATPase subunit